MVDTSGLSIRQRQVFHLVGQCMTTKQIGRELDISPRTVEVHIAEVKQKLGARSKIHLALMAHGVELKETNNGLRN